MPIVIGWGKIGGTKFSSRKSHGAEYSAGIVVFGGNAYLIRNTVFRCRYHILSRANYPYYGEDTERNRDKSSVAVAELIAKAADNTVGHIAATATANAITNILRLSDLCVEYYRVYDLYCCPLTGMLKVIKITEIYLDLSIAIYGDMADQLSKISVCNALKL